MTVHDSHATVETPTIPHPREAEDDVVPTLVALPDAVETPAPPAVGEYPWPEPWRHSRGARPRSEFWDVATASWHSRGAYPRTDEH